MSIAALSRSSRWPVTWHSYQQARAAGAQLTQVTFMLLCIRAIEVRGYVFTTTFFTDTCLQSHTHTHIHTHTHTHIKIAHSHTCSVQTFASLCLCALPCYKLRVQASLRFVCWVLCALDVAFGGGCNNWCALRS
jgi:hypothetical protein